MRIKRFEAKDITTAMAMVKEEMGDDAIILATRTLKPQGKNGEKPSRPRVEVMAARDYDIEEVIEKSSPAAASSPAPAPDTYDYSAVRKPAAANDTRQAKTPAAPAAKPLSEAQDLRLRFANLFRRPRPEGDKAAVRMEPPAAPSGPGTPKKRKKPSREEVIRWRDQVVSQVRLAQPEVGGAPVTIALVGATGVGKTTTAAKLAAWYNLRQNCRVALLSMDCYRIGATDQLRAYARIMRIPCEVALRKNDLRKALNRHQDKDLIIIDTAGKSPYDEAHINELNEWFADCPEVEPHLVLSATTKKEDLEQTIKSYAAVNAENLILTKLDETRAYASLCQQVVAAKLPISYLCTGQRVPEDFMVASKEYLDTLFKKGWQAANTGALS